MENAKYLEWITKDLEDSDLIEELNAVKGNEEEINDRFRCV